MKERINIIIEDLDDIISVLKSVELLFQKLIFYYADTNVENLHTLIVSCSVWFGKILQVLGYDEDEEKL